MSFLERFRSSLESSLPESENTKFVVAYSGGVDSHVLLYCCHRLNLDVRAVHVHHGLQQAADDWVDHCQQVCDRLNIQLDVIYVDASKKHRQSPEETARAVRYQAIGNNLEKEDCLLTAQHLDDQAETFLIQLFRAAGSAGLSAMPVSKTVGDKNCLHHRPMLGFSRQEIVAFAEENDLDWIEDPSNQDTSYDRNYIRHELLPELEKRWQQLPERLTAVASLQAENLQVLEDMAKIDLVEASCEAGQSHISIYQTVSQLSISRLRTLSAARLHNLLRYWIKSALSDARHSSVRSPTRKLLYEIERTLIQSMSDANPVVSFSGYQFRRFQDVLYLLYLHADGVEPEQISWDASQVLELPLLKCSLSIKEGISNGLDKRLLEKELRVAFRQGGEQFHPAARQHSQSLKKLFQEAGVAPWERETVPLLYCGDDLVAVVGLWLSRDHIVGECETGWGIDVEKL